MQYHCGTCGKHVNKNNSGKCPECGAALHSAPLEPGAIIAGFQILGELGRGSNGVVYRAKQLSLERDVALKILPEDKAEDPDFVKNFLREARAAANLNHHNIVQGYDAGVSEDGTYFFAMELISGQTAEDILNERGALDFDLVMRIGRTVANALAYAWNKQKLLHGDIKPDNIIVRRDGEVKLADLGLASTIFDEKPKELMGTPMYAPPELIRSEKNSIGIQTDMYSLGVTLYELFAGEPPYDESDPVKVLDLHLKSKHIPLVEKIPGFNPDISRLIDKMLAKSVRDRPKTWEEIIDALYLRRTHRDELHFDKNKKTKFTLLIIALIVAIAIAAALVAFIIESNIKPQIAPVVEKAETQKTQRPEATVPEPAFNNPFSDDVPANEAQKPRTQLPAKQVARLIKSAAAVAPRQLSSLALLRDEISQLLAETVISGEASSAAAASALKTALQVVNKKIVSARKSLSIIRVAEIRREIVRTRGLAAKEKKRLDGIAKEISDNLPYWKSIARFNQLKPTSRNMSGAVSVFRGVDIRKLSPEYYIRARLLLKALPERYHLQKIFIPNAASMENETLPWKISHKRYRIIGTDKKFLRIITKLSEGAFSRKKIKWNNISYHQWKMLINRFFFKRGFIQGVTGANTITAWLFAHGDKQGLDAFTRQANFSSSRRDLWLACAADRLSANAEIAVREKLIAIGRLLAREQYARAGEIISELEKNMSAQIVGDSRRLLAFYAGRANLFSPENQAQQQYARINANPNFSNALTLSFRYGNLKVVSDKTRRQLADLRSAVLRQALNNKKYSGQFGLLSPLPAGAVFGWAAPNSEQAFHDNQILFLPATLDAAQWGRIRMVVEQKTYDLARLFELKSVLNEWFPALLYNLGLAALRYDDGPLQERVLRSFMSLLEKKSVSESESFLAAALGADLALKYRKPAVALKLLDLYKLPENPDSQHVAIAMLELEARLLDQPEAIREFSKIADYYQTLFSKAETSGIAEDVKAIRLAKQIVVSRKIPEKNAFKITLKNAACPEFAARLLSATAARNVYLEFSHDVPQWLYKCIAENASSSVFQAELWYRTALLGITMHKAFPATQRRESIALLNDFRLAAAPSYPALLMLWSGTEIISGRATADKISHAMASYTNRCQIFADSEKLSLKILNSRQPEQLPLRLSAKGIAIKKIFWLSILAATKTITVPGKAALGGHFSEMYPRLLWEERLFMRNYIEMLVAAYSVK